MQRVACDDTINYDASQKTQGSYEPLNIKRVPHIAICYLPGDSLLLVNDVCWGLPCVLCFAPCKHVTASDRLLPPRWILWSLYAGQSGHSTWY